MINKENLISMLLDKGICSKVDIAGCMPWEVAKLENSLEVQLPKQYKEFLLSVGHGAGKFFQGTDIFLSQIKDIKAAAVELLEENEEPFKLTDRVFVFMMHQGYVFCYFVLREGDDPPVYQYVEGEGIPKLTWKSFSEFLEDSIKEHFLTKGFM